MSEILQLNEIYNDETRKEIFLEFCEKIITFTFKHQMTHLKIWTILLIFKEFHKYCCENNIIVENAIKIFKDILLRHSMERPPFSICIFSFGDLEPIMNFMIQKYVLEYMQLYFNYNI